MKTTGLKTIDHAPQVVAEWLNELCDDLGWGKDKSRAYMLLRGTLHALRDQLPVSEAADLSAQLPLLVRGIYFDGWVPSRTPARPRSKDAFLARVAEPFADPPLDDPEEAVAAVFDLLRRKVSRGETEQIASLMRKDLAGLWD